MSASLDLLGIAQAYVDSRSDVVGKTRLAELSSVYCLLDGDFCLEVADYVDRAPVQVCDADLLSRYDRLKDETLAQFHALRDAGLTVLPWRAAGQPYGNSADLIDRVRRTGVLYVYLTRDGHGPAGSLEPRHHPMRDGSGVRVAGVEFSHNDLFRAVHDAFGHVMFGNDFGPEGELKAVYCHIHMYSPCLEPLLFTEHLGQVCWFYFGAHLRDGNGQIPARDSPDYVPPARRPYAEQKVFMFDQGFIDRFHGMFGKQETV
ncbi:hypothetical protein [Micromonospora sp. LOL_021]|uniref:hypothetical protein n=1 Tax=Micromonospora sp. LOL_021 TaxID=3345417 RepID=UPI003A8BA863